MMMNDDDIVLLTLVINVISQICVICKHVIWLASFLPYASFFSL